MAEEEAEVRRPRWVLLLLLRAARRTAPRAACGRLRVRAGGRAGEEVPSRESRSGVSGGAGWRVLVPLTEGPCLH